MKKDATPEVEVLLQRYCDDDPYEIVTCNYGYVKEIVFVQADHIFVQADRIWAKKNFNQILYTTTKIATPVNIANILLNILGDR